MTTQDDGAVVTLADGSSVGIAARTEVYANPERRAPRDAATSSES